MLSENEKNALTPMMRQYFELKDKYSDSILLFRLGDFYEMFFDDAIIASKILDIVLTKRDCGLPEKAPMCGIPHHVLEMYLPKLVQSGHKAAIVEQLEDPKKAKGIVKRDVIRIVSPGTVIGDELITNSSNFILSLFVQHSGIGYSFSDISTGEVYFSESFCNFEDIAIKIQNIIERINPSEILINSELNNNIQVKKIFDSREVLVSYYEAIFDFGKSYINIKKYYTTDQVKGLKKFNLSVVSLSTLLDYIYNFQKNKLEHFKTPSLYDEKKYMELDQSTRDNLNISSKSTPKSLFEVLDYTSTSMGSRMLENRIQNPLLDKNEIEKRLDLVEEIINFDNRNEIEILLNQISDIERLLGRLSYNRVNAKDLILFRDSFKIIPEVKKLLLTSKTEISQNLAHDIDELDDIYSLIANSIVDDPPTTIKEGGIIKIGYSKQLDELRNTSVLGISKLQEFEINEKERLGIKNLKIIFNKKTGYFIDITKSNASRIPEEYLKVQTLTNSDRYTCNELKLIESMIFTSEEDTVNLEIEIFEEICNEILKNTSRIQKNINIVSELDFSNSLAKAALNNNYIRPQFNESQKISMTNSRHPIIESANPLDDFIANNVEINRNNNFQIITGPNMSGKSTYLRQIALICIMAQIGSFVPCDSCDIAILDRVFTRIGASDNIVMGDSTFMVEMRETAYILKNATENSLVLLDEVGRGTSTYDGLSIAWALVEYISRTLNSYTLFATHYHELTVLEKKLKNVINLSVSVKENRDTIVFMHKINHGAESKSFGIQVAEMAGFPESVTNRAKTVLKSIESTSSLAVNENKVDDQVDLSSYQKDLFIDHVRNIDLNTYSPIEALNKLNDIISEAKCLGDD